MSRRLIAALAAGALLTLPACSGGETGPQRTAAEQLAAAKQHADSASSVHLTVTSRDVPDTAEGILGLDGVGTHAPAFKGVLEARVRGINAKIDTVAIGPDLWLKLPFTPRHVKTDPASWGVPSPAQLLSADKGLTALITHTQNPQDGGQAREGQEVVRTITGTIPGANVAQILNTGDPKGTYQVSYGLTDPDGQLRKASITGPFFPGATSSYDVVFDRYDEPVEITDPTGGEESPTAPPPATPTAPPATPAAPTATPTGTTPGTGRATPGRPTTAPATPRATTTPSAPATTRATATAGSGATR